MTFDDLEYFLALYEEKNFTTAAQRLYVTQQCLSKSIQRLENFYGTPLFLRRPAIIPTYAAERLANAAHMLLREKKKSDKELKDFAAQQCGRINFGVSHHIAANVIPAIVKEYQPTHPGITVETSTDINKISEKKTLDGALDFYLGSSETNSIELMQSFLFDIGLCIAVRESVLKMYTNLKSIDFSQIEANQELSVFSHCPFIMPRRLGFLRASFDNYINSKAFIPHIALETTVNTTIRSIIEGIGAGVVYSITTLPESVEDDPIYKFHVFDEKYRLKIYLIHRKDHYISSCEEDFYTLLFKYASRYSVTLSNQYCPHKRTRSTFK